MKFFIIFLLIVLLVILILNKNSEGFMDEKLRAKLLNGIALNMGEIENLNSLIIKSVPNSEKLLIENIIKNYTVDNLIFNRNLDLVDYVNITGINLPKKYELKYNKNQMENINNFYTSFAVGPGFSTNPKNPYYGVQFKYQPSNNSIANRAELGLDYFSYMEGSIEKLVKMKETFEDKNYKEMTREKVEVMAPMTKKFEFLPYFKDKKVKALVLFDGSKNEEFLKELEGKFNLLDEKGNRILTKCILDNPYCNTHLPQKGKIYGRDQYVATKFYPYNDNFRVLLKDNIDPEELERIRQEMKNANQGLGPNGVRIGPNGEIIGPNGEIIVASGGRIGPNGEIIGPNGEIIVASGWRIGPNGEIIGPNGERIGPNGERIGPNGEIIGPNGEIVGIEGGKNGLAISYFNYDPTSANTRKEKGSFIEKGLHTQAINFDWTWTEDDPENEIIIGDKKDNVYLLIEGFIKAPKNGNVVFQVTSDDGVRIDIAGETQLKNEEGIVTDTWIGQPMTPYTTNSISMKKDKFYKLKIEYYEGGSAGGLKLEWKWDGETDFQVVPANVFFTSGQNSGGTQALNNQSNNSSGLTLNVTFDNNGKVSAFAIENGGSNYKKGQSVYLEKRSRENQQDYPAWFKVISTDSRGSVTELERKEHSVGRTKYTIKSTTLTAQPTFTKLKTKVDTCDDGRDIIAWFDKFHWWVNKDEGGYSYQYVDSGANQSPGTLDKEKLCGIKEVNNEEGKRIPINSMPKDSDGNAKFWHDNREKNIKEGFVGDFQDTSDLPTEDQAPPYHDYYQKYLRKKDCVKEKNDLKQRILDDHYLEEKEINLVAPKEKLEPLQKLAGFNCIKHHDKFRDDYFFGGFDENNKMFCYGKDEECILFPNKDECEKMDLKSLLSVPKEEIVKGLEYNTQRTVYDMDTLKLHQEQLEAELNESEQGMEIKCGTGKYLDGTFNPEDEISIVGGIYKDCNDPNHPNHDNCNNSPTPSESTYYLSELLTTKGKKIYNPSKNDKYSQFGEINTKCIDNNIPEGRLEPCDPLDDHQACYVGNRPSLVPGESEGIPNTDLYNKYLGYNCDTFTLNTNTCKHNNNGVLSDIITFSSPIEKNYQDILNNQAILEVSNEYDMDMMTDEEKYKTKNNFLYIEKYLERYEDMNPKNHMKPRYTLKFDIFYDLITKKDEIMLCVYHNGVKEATLNTNQGEIHFLREGDIIEILIQQNNHLLFRVVNPATRIVVSQYISTNKIEGEYGSPTNFYISQNNNSFFKDIKYKDEIPKIILPYNPFVKVSQI